MTRKFLCTQRRMLTSIQLSVTSGSHFTDERFSSYWGQEKKSGYGLLKNCSFFTLPVSGYDDAFGSSQHGPLFAIIT